MELLTPDDAIFEHADANLTLNEIANIYGVPTEVSHPNNLRNILLFVKEVTIERGIEDYY